DRRRRLRVGDGPRFLAGGGPAGQRGQPGCQQQPGAEATRHGGPFVEGERKPAGQRGGTAGRSRVRPQGGGDKDFAGRYGPGGSWRVRSSSQWSVPDSPSGGSRVSPPVSPIRYRLNPSPVRNAIAPAGSAPTRRIWIGLYSMTITIRSFSWRSCSIPRNASGSDPSASIRRKSIRRSAGPKNWSRATVGTRTSRAESWKKSSSAGEQFHRLLPPRYRSRR